MEVFQAEDNFVEIADHSEEEEKTDYRSNYAADDGEFDVIQDADDDFESEFDQLDTSSRPKPNASYAYVDPGEINDDGSPAADFETSAFSAADDEPFDQPEGASPADESWAEELLRESSPQRSASAAAEAEKASWSAAVDTADGAYHGSSAGGGLDTLRAERIAIRGNFSTAGIDRSVYWRPFVGGALALLLALTLVAQLAWLHFDKLAARFPGLIPYYQSVCSMLDCTLPSLYDLSRIKSQDLVVRAHPVEPEALIVDSILINTADFRQPYPDILLRFSDIGDTLIASRRFTPEEYYPDRSSEDPFMPPNAPVKIVLEIRDPGRAAVNYRLDFRPSIRYRSAASTGDKLSNSGL